MASTVKKIRAGSKCEKAQALEEILVALEDMPEADELVKSCEEYLASVQQVADDDDFEESHHHDEYHVNDENIIDEGQL